MDTAPKVASVGNCIISVWSVQTCFRVSQVFPPDSVPHPGFWIIFFGSILYPPKRVSSFFKCLQLSRILGMSCESSSVLLGGMRCGLARGWVHAQLEFAMRAARGGCGSSMTKRALRDVHSDEFGDWGGRAVCRWAGVAQLARRAGSLAIDGVGVG